MDYIATKEIKDFVKLFMNGSTNLENAKDLNRDHRTRK